ncbi:Dnpep, partial [Symbiodinium microadriaticum]
ESALLALIGNHIGYDSDEIMSYDLSLFDTQGAVVTDYGGCIYSSRLDNQASCYAALEALCAHTSSQSFHQDEQVSMVALFDHEEVGSGSSVGAGSTLMADALERVHHALCVAPDCHDQLKIAQRR